MAQPWNLGPPVMDFAPLGQLGNSFFNGYKQGKGIYQENERQRLIDEAMQKSGGALPGLQDLAAIAFRTGQTGDALQALGLAGQNEQRNAQTEMLRQELILKQRQAAQQDELSRALGGLAGGGAAPQSSTSSARPVFANGGADPAANAISSIESSGRYDALGPVVKNGDRAFGKYQVMGNNIGPWTEKYLGRRMTPREFLASPEAQEAVFRGEFGRLQAKYGPEGAARAWFAGEGGMNDPNRKDVLGTSVAQYGQKFMRNYQPGSAIAAAPDGTPIQAADVPQSGSNFTPRPIPAQAAQPGQTAPPPSQAPIVDAQTQSNLQKADRGKLEQLLVMPAMKDNPGARSLIEAELKRRDALNEPTTLQKDYRAAKAEGFKGTLEDWRKLNQPQVNIDQKGETEEAKAVGKGAGEAQVEMFKGAGQASQNLARLSRLNALSEQVATGKLAPGRFSMAELGRSLGVDEKILQGIGLDPKQAATATAMNSLINQLTVGQIGPGGFPSNNFSEGDRKFLVDTMPSIANDPRANAIMIETARRVEQLKIDKAKSFKEWKSANPKSSYFDFETEWADKQAQTNKFDDLIKRADALMAGQQPQMPPANKVGPRPGVQDGMTATNPQTGQKIILRNGKWEPLQ